MPCSSGSSATEASQLTEIHKDLTPVADHLRLTVADGKRLRAALCYLGVA